MFSKSIDVIVKTHLKDVIDYKLVGKAAQPSEFKNIKIESRCPFSRFANKFNTRTIRTCDGVNRLFEKSLLVSSCSDFYVKADGDKFESSAPDLYFGMQEHRHSEIQVTPFKFYPKIIYPAYIETRNNLRFLLHKAYYHSKNERKYPTGIVGGGFFPNIIFELEPNTEDFIEYREPLVYLTALTEKKIKVHHELITEDQFNGLKLKLISRQYARHSYME